MITGFNTDVKHGSKVYHVQTEDKGRNNPKIETLVYVGGEILDNYRTSYEKSKAELTEEKIMELLEKQHKRVVRTIKIGKYDEPVTFSKDVISDRTLDQVILDYLGSEDNPDHIKLIANGVATLLRNHASLLNLETRKVLSNMPVEGAEIRIKLVAPDHDAFFLNRGVTDANGTLSLQVKIPEHGEGKYSLLIQAISEWGTAEQKFPLKR